MNDLPTRKWLGRSLVALLITACLLTASLITYGVHVRTSARLLIISAGQMHSMADMEREVARWRHSPGYTESRSPDGLSRAFRTEIDNSLLSALHVVSSAGVQLQVSAYGGEFQMVLLGLYAGRSSVWVEEDLTGRSQRSLYVNTQRDASGKPLKTVVILTAELDVGTRKSAFALNADCLVKPGGCDTAEEILPALRQIENAAR